jgi:hypothetical protein
MNHPPAPLPDDDWLDRALRVEGREHRDDYLPDAGFTARVMGTLPAPPALPAWRKPALALLWGTAGIGLALALPGVAMETAREVLRMLVEQPISLPGMAVGVAALAAASWAGAAIVVAND